MWPKRFGTAWKRPWIRVGRPSSPPTRRAKKPSSASGRGSRLLLLDGRQATSAAWVPGTALPGTMLSDPDGNGLRNRPAACSGRGAGVRRRALRHALSLRGGAGGASRERRLSPRGLGADPVRGASLGGHGQEWRRHLSTGPCTAGGGG